MTLAAAARPLTSAQVAVVQDSFTRIAPKADALAAEFYRRLFAAAPAVRALFPDDMTGQREKLVSTLAFVVRGLSDFSAIEKTVRELGVRHRGYKAEPQHYEVVGAALLATLQSNLGERWTPELREAWTAAFKALADTMIDAAHGRGA